MPQKIFAFKLQNLIREKTAKLILNPMAETIPIYSRKSVRLFQTNEWISFSICSYKISQEMISRMRKIF